MYGLPAGFDPTVMAGTFLTKVGFGKASLHLDLSRPEGHGRSGCASFVVVGRYSYSVAGESFDGDASQPLSGTRLVMLLNNDVTEVKVLGRGDLLIGLGPGNQIHFIDDDSGYESYAIYIPGEKEIIV
jgi:hypothetical protein